MQWPATPAPRPRWTVVVVLLCQLAASASAYNLDLLNPIVVGDGRRGMFGYSVSFHSTTKGNRPVAIVGAPRDTQINSAANGHRETGAVYRCSLRYDDMSCSQLEIDTAANEVTEFRSPDNRVASYSEAKSYMRLGATVLSSGPGKPVWACAPHYHDVFDLPPKERRGAQKRWDPVGRCYSLPGDLDASKFPLAEDAIVQPCESQARFQTQQYGKFAQLYTCTTGISLDFVNRSSNTHDALIGGPDSRYIQGRVYTTGAGPVAKTSRTYRASPIDPGLVTKVKTPFIRAGFAVTNGHYSRGRQDVAFSAPLYDRYYGAVFVSPLDGARSLLGLYDLNFALKWQDRLPDADVTLLHGQQHGEFFGFALASADVNGDGVHELLVGAPMYSDGLVGSVDGEVVSGRVYVYGESLSNAISGSTAGVSGPDFGSASSATEVPPNLKITGKIGAQFGRAIAALGDLDQDGYEDVAIGAPYEDGTGAVHIHYGSRDGLLPTSAQVITPSDLGLPGLSTFGLAIGKGFDMDGNNYNDVIIGAPESNRVIALRSRPVVDVKVFFSSDASGRETSDYVADIANSDCAFNSVANLPCFQVHVCATNTSELPRESSLEVAFDIVMDNNLLGHPDASVRHLRFNGSFSLENSRGPKCEPRTIYLRNDIRFPCRPATLKVDWKLIELDSTEARLSPIVRATNVQNPVIAKIDMTGPCSNCLPDMSVLPATFFTSDNSRDTVIAGQTETAQLSFTVHNIGTMIGCRSEAFVTLPSGVRFIGDIVPGNQSCLLDEGHEVPNTVRCVLPPAMIPYEQEQIVMELNMKQISELPRMATITISVKSNNTEDPSTLENNQYTVPLTIFTKARMTVVAKSQHRSVEVPNGVAQPSTLEEVGPEMTHLFQALNLGPSSTPPAQLAISWPVKTPADTELLYLTKVESPRRQIRCNHSSLLDPEQLRSKDAINGTYSVMPNVDSASSSVQGDVATIICDIPSLVVKDSASIQITWRVRAKSIHDAALLPSNVSTSISLVGFEARDGYEWLTDQDTGLAEALTELVGYVEVKASSLKLWHIIVPIVVGLILILLLILLLYKCGFFKRTKEFDIPARGAAGQGARPTSEV
ncbi:integrin alpha-5-like [Sycon ciliatum]|uniref:integrin alpha-5-like n=1 Tax=Sycon ciliatum TaxID=27933 RepID=UPI0020AE5BF2